MRNETAKNNVRLGEFSLDFITNHFTQAHGEDDETVFEFERKSKEGVNTDIVKWKLKMANCKIRLLLFFKIVKMMYYWTSLLIRLPVPPSLVSNEDVTGTICSLTVVLTGKVK
jgi:hypothetical protein